jgi:hypothetical protein
MKFVLPDGKEVAGRSYGDIVRQMNDEKFTPATNIDTYRRQLAKRVESLYGKVVDATTDKTLVSDLVDIGLLVRLP